MPNLKLLNLSDIYQEIDRGRAAQRIDETYQRGLAQERTLADIFSRQEQVDQNQGSHYQPAKPATPDRPYTEQDIGSGVGPYQIGSQIPGTGTPVVAEKPSIPANGGYDALRRLEYQATMKRRAAQAMAAKGFGSIASKLATEADVIDEKIINAKVLMVTKTGGDFKHPGLIEDASGNLYNQYVRSDGTTVTKNALGDIIDPRTIRNPKITKGNAYIQVAGPGGTTVVQPAPRAGGSNTPYRAPVQADVEQVGKEYKESLEPIVPVMDRLDKLITPIEKGGGKIPGVGFANNTRVGQLANDKGVGGSIYRDSTALANAILKIRSGLAVTAQEEARTLIEMGRNPLASAGAFMDQFRKLQDAVDKMHSRISSQYGEAARIFDERQSQSGGYLTSKSPWMTRREKEKSGGQSILDKYGVK